MRKLKATLVFALWLAYLYPVMFRALASPSAATTTNGVPIATSFIYPVGISTIAPTWNPNSGNGYFVTQGFNTSCDPSLGQGYYMYGLYYCGHSGVDLATQGASSVIHATANGVVVEAGYNGSYGVMVRIRHYLPDGSVIYSQYEHMAYGSLAVYSGEIVTQGQELGLVGATGFATGAHLHFEIKTVDDDGYGYSFGNASLLAGYMDPLPFVAAHQLQPAKLVSGTGRPIRVWPAETDAILKTFLKSYQHFVVVSTSDGLRVRSGPSLHAHVMGVALRGARLGYIQTKGQWLRVALPQHVTGWVSLHYVTGYQDWGRPRHTKSTTWPPLGKPLAIVDPRVALALNVRSGPGQSHSVISVVYERDKLEVLARTASWDRVLTQDGTRGWVLRRYLDDPGFSYPTLPPTITAEAAVLNVRSGPGLQYGVTGTVFKGTRMQLVRLTPHWAAVLLPGDTTGWIARPYTSDYKPVVATGVQAARSAPAPRGAAQATYVRVIVSVLNIRSAPGRSHPVIARVLKNTNLVLLSSTAHWAHVALPASRIDGWVLRTLTR